MSHSTVASSSSHSADPQLPPRNAFQIQPAAMLTSTMSATATRSVEDLSAATASSIGGVMHHPVASALPASSSPPPSSSPTPVKRSSIGIRIHPPGAKMFPTNSPPTIADTVDAAIPSPPSTAADVATTAVPSMLGSNSAPLTSNHDRIEQVAIPPSSSHSPPRLHIGGTKALSHVHTLPMSPLNRLAPNAATPSAASALPKHSKLVESSAPASTPAPSHAAPAQSLSDPCEGSVATTVKDSCENDENNEEDGDIGDDGDDMPELGSGDNNDANEDEYEDDAEEYEDGDHEIEHEFASDEELHSDPDDSLEPDNQEEGEQQGDEEENSVPNRRPVDILSPLVESQGEAEESLGELDRRRRRRVARLEADRMQAFGLGLGSRCGRDTTKMSNATTTGTASTLVAAAPVQSSTTAAKLHDAKVAIGTTSRVPIKSSSTSSNTPLETAVPTYTQANTAVSQFQTNSPLSDTDSLPSAESSSLPLSSSAVKPDAVGIAPSSTITDGKISAATTTTLSTVEVKDTRDAATAPTASSLPPDADIPSSGAASSLPHAALSQSMNQSPSSLTLPSPLSHHCPIFASPSPTPTLSASPQSSANLASSATTHTSLNPASSALSFASSSSTSTTTALAIADAGIPINPSVTLSLATSTSSSPTIGLPLVSSPLSSPLLTPSLPSIPNTSPTTSPLPSPSSLTHPSVGPSSMLRWTTPASFDPNWFRANYSAEIHDLYFAYGSNLNLDRMRARRVGFIGDRCVSARLAQFRLVFNKVSESLPPTDRYKRGAIGYANLVPAQNGQVFGAMYIVPKSSTSSSLVSSDSPPIGLAALDVYEGVSQSMYSRHLVPLTLQDGTNVVATTYLACPSASAPNPDQLAPTRTYLNHLLAGKDILPPFYYDHLQSIRLSWMADPAAAMSHAQSLEMSEPIQQDGTYKIVASTTTASHMNSHCAVTVDTSAATIDWRLGLAVDKNGHNRSDTDSSITSNHQSLLINGTHPSPIVSPTSSIPSPSITRTPTHVSAASLASRTFTTPRDMPDLCSKVPPHIDVPHGVDYDIVDDLSPPGVTSPVAHDVVDDGSDDDGPPDESVWSDHCVPNT